MKKELTYKQLKTIIKECACEAMKDSHMGGMPSIKMIKLGKPDTQAGLFPGMGLDHMDHDDSHWDDHDQGEKSMILANLAKMSDKALELRDLAAGVPDNEEWVQEKIAVASAMIDSIYNYLKYKQD
jgi:hypothetical protein